MYWADPSSSSPSLSSTRRPAAAAARAASAASIAARAASGPPTGAAGGPPAGAPGSSGAIGPMSGAGRPGRWNQAETSPSFRASRAREKRAGSMNLPPADTTST